MRIGRFFILTGIAAVIISGCGQSGYEQIPLPGNGSLRVEAAQPERTESREAVEDAGNEMEESIPEKDHAADTAVIQIGEVSGNPEEETGAEAGPGIRDGSEEAAEKKKITLLFGGDVYLSDHVLKAWEAAGGIRGVLDEGYQKAAAEADFFMVNQEFPFSSRGVQAPDKQFTFRLPPERVEIFNQMGIDGVTLANNHALDFGQEALMDSCTVLDGAGILHTGAGENLEAASREIHVEVSGKKIALIGATRVIPVSTWAAGESHAGMLATYDPALLLERIRQLRQDHDYVIVYVHWGIEREEMPKEYQRTLGHQYVDAGADLVIGAHPHVLQGIEYYKGKPVVYSLGNFVFGSSIPRTMLLEVTIPADSQDGELGLKVLPGTSSAGYTRMHQDSGALEEFYRYLEEISFGVEYGADGTVTEKVM